MVAEDTGEIQFTVVDRNPCFFGRILCAGDGSWVEALVDVVADDLLCVYTRKHQSVSHVMMICKDIGIEGKLLGF